MKVGVLISGRGTNLQALIDACAAPGFPAEIAAVISNKPGAKGLERARQAGIPHFVVNHREYETREAFEVVLDGTLRGAGVEFICNAGFMRILTPYFVNKWHDRQINIHPSLLPAFPGLNVHERVIESGVRISGCTIHFVRAETDDGPIIAQAAVPVWPEDTQETLAMRVLEAEHTTYPLAIKLIAENRVRVIGNRVEYHGVGKPTGQLIMPEPDPV